MCDLIGLDMDLALDNHDIFNSYLHHTDPLYKWVFLSKTRRRANKRNINAVQRLDKEVGSQSLLGEFADWMKSTLEFD